MISKFFSQSKPINFVVVSAILLVIFVVTKYMTFDMELNTLLITKQILLFGVCLFAVFVLDFLVNKNNLTKKNSYTILLFVLFIAVLPETLMNSKTVIANLFILFALRRIISLRSKKEIKKKLFDASFWITIASLFYFWSALFFILILVALVLFVITELKNWLIPLIGISTVAAIAASYMILMSIDIYSFFNNLIDVSFDFSTLNSKRIIIGTTILLSFGVWSLFYYIKNLKSKTKSSRPSFSLIVIAAIIGLVIIIVSPIKSGSEFVFLFAPLAIIMTNYLEVISEKWFKESLLWILLLVPIITLLL
ncbi:DUF6427 family protein [Psychroserpens ponticola]|uniref:DUF6427 family protein n=1 Tax=Psychroserpens ponticola TaxID=2932268 RepID=A0ABY7RWY9_9FLAO|nr:DUF6427 family protein [Psychroserpens ponticola]WCO01629.1 DUF6427 family protein [Psychroserpens ponticola]